MGIKRTGLVAALVFLSGVCRAEAPLAYTAIYEGSYAGLGITATRNFSCTTTENSGQQSCRLATRLEAALGQITESSDFLLDGDQITAQNYRYDQKFFLSQRHRSMDFSLPGIVSFVDRHGAKTITIDQPHLDNLSYQFALSLATLKGQSVVEIPIVRRGKLDLLRFEREVVEQQSVSGNMIDTVRFAQQREDNDKRIEIWLAPSLGGVMTRIRYTEDDSSYALNLVSANFETAD